MRLASTKGDSPCHQNHCKITRKGNLALCDSKLGSASSPYPYHLNHLPCACWWGVPHRGKNLARHQRASPGPRERSGSIAPLYCSQSHSRAPPPLTFTCCLHHLVWFLEIQSYLSNLPLPACIPTPAVSIISLKPQCGAGREGKGRGIRVCSIKFWVPNLYP